MLFIALFIIFFSVSSIAYLIGFLHGNSKAFIDLTEEQTSKTNINND
jgi:hypothetical protein